MNLKLSFKMPEEKERADTYMAAPQMVKAFKDMRDWLHHKRRNTKSGVEIAILEETINHLSRVLEVNELDLEKFSTD